MEIKFQPIIPQVSPFTNFDLGYVAEQALQEFGNLLKTEFESTTSTWKKPVRFTVRYERGQNKVRVFTKDEIYGYVNDGVRPHAIHAANVSVLRYKKGYAAKTMPGKIRASNGGKSGPDMFSPSVMHPGIQARNFDDLIYRKMVETGAFNKIFGRILSEYVAKRK